MAPQQRSLAPPKVHACTEIRAGVNARTFCGIAILTNEDRRSGRTGAGSMIPFTRKNISAVTCGRCLRGCA